MKSLLIAAAIFAASPVLAGGPVMIEDEYEVTEPAPRGNWVVPVLIGGIILCILACEGGDDPAPDTPGVICRDAVC